MSWMETSWGYLLVTLPIRKTGIILNQQMIIRQATRYDPLKGTRNSTGVPNW